MEPINRITMTPAIKVGTFILLAPFVFLLCCRSLYSQGCFPVRVLPREQIDHSSQQNDSHYRPDAESPGKQHTDPVHDHGNSIGEHAHVADGEGCPLAVIHLPLDGTHS